MVGQLTGPICYPRMPLSGLIPINNKYASQLSFKSIYDKLLYLQKYLQKLMGIKKNPYDKHIERKKGDYHGIHFWIGINSVLHYLL